MAHAHSHDHGGGHAGHSHAGHDHGSGTTDKTRVLIAACLTGGFMVAEVAGGLITGSLALLADAGHMLTDSIALWLAWYAFRLAERPATARLTYGFGPRQDAGRLHQRHHHLCRRGVDRLRGGAPLHRARPRSGRTDARRCGAGPVGQHRRLPGPAWRRPREPQHARRRAACAGRPAGLGRGDHRRPRHHVRPAGRRSIRSCRCWSRCSSCPQPGR